MSIAGSAFPHTQIEVFRQNDLVMELLCAVLRHNYTKVAEMWPKLSDPLGSLRSDAKATVDCFSMLERVACSQHHFLSTTRRKKTSRNRKQETELALTDVPNLLTPKEMYAPSTLPAIVAKPAVMMVWSSDLVTCGK